MSMNSAQARVMLFAAIVCASTAAPLVKAVPGESPLFLGAWRLGLAGVVLSLLSGRRGVFFSLDLWRVSALPGLFLALHFAAWFASLEMTSVAASTTLVATTPLFAALLAPFLLGERTSGRQWLGVFVGMLGSAWIAGIHGAAARSAFGGSRQWMGDALALLAALAASLYLIIGRRLRSRVPLSGYFAAVCLWGGLFLTTAALLAGVTLGPVSEPPRGVGLWMVVVALALVPQVGGHGLLNAAMRRLPAQQAQLALLGEPLLSSLWVVLFFDQWPSPGFYPGGAMVLLGLALGVHKARHSTS